jgi:signal transduction histidine kinase
LPLRPTTARLLIDAARDDATSGDLVGIGAPKTRTMCELDPGWALAVASAQPGTSVLSVLAGRAWWSRRAASGPIAELLGRLWRHSLAVSIAARSFAREASDPDPDIVARAGQLSGLGYWAIAANDPEWFLSWWREADPRRRRQKESDELGFGLLDLGRRLAERWNCEPLVVDSAWLHCDDSGALNSAASSPGRLSLIQRAYRLAEHTPWSLSGQDLDVAQSEPRLRILVAEVQARSGGAFIDPDATPHEERMTRENARLRLELLAARHLQNRAERFLTVLAESTLADAPEDWVATVAKTWCAEPGVTAARGTWWDLEAAGPKGRPGVAQPHAELPSSSSGPAQRSPTFVLPLGTPTGARAAIEVWSAPEASGPTTLFSSVTALRAWDTWAVMLAERAQLERRLQRVVASFRQHLENAEASLRRGKLDALGEFAAGAGHELNNPLAVIVGRAQLLLARTNDAEVVRSLRIILNQAQRTHRILRDLMFIARPPAPRRRSCRPSETLRVILGDFERACLARNVQLVCTLDDSTTETWADPEALAHLVEVLLQNALQATPSGGTIQVRSIPKRDELIWSISDNGKGISATEAAHLFDPFFCGRQAGRGLGLGLPRAARMVELAGGRLRWSSNPGRETIFQVHLPIALPPASPGQNLASADGPPERRSGARAS